IFARAVNCEKPENGSPCGTCKICRALSEGSLDIAEIDAASNNGVNEMRDLREKVQYPPVSGKYKVYIIDEVHMLTDSAFNALLKTLEEPPQHAIFILATTEPQKLPATILSRCMRLDFKLIPTEDLVKHLKSILKGMGKEYEDEAVEAIARAGAGSDRDMLSIAEMCLAYSDKLTYDGVTAVLGAADFKETCTLAGQLIAPDLASALTTAEKILSAGRSVGVLCRDILQALNMIAIAKACPNAESLLMIPKEHFRLVSKIAEVADGRAILRVTDIFVRLEPELRYATSPRICFETAVMRAALPNADLDLDAFAVRVSNIEKRLSQGVTFLNTALSEEREPEMKVEEAPFETGDFPTEEPVFDYEEPPQEEEKPVKKVKEVKAEPPKPQEIAPLPKDASAEMVFGKFMRALRKAGSNGVLYT
ncbi:MAG: DNA polymerase III subunit gamma/tau, partial [Clostridia bacterium]|nr:DNA polymerase III subunit gamma/tau [Clostridia bacterium]